MKELDARSFAALFAAAYRKCFGSDFTTPLTESESLHFSVEITEGTGREIGWKSLKNYSHYLLGQPQGKPENPSTQTLDTLAQYVAGVPGDVREQQGGRRHYSHWYRYREAFQQSQPRLARETPVVARSRRPLAPIAMALAVVLAGVLLLVLARRGTGKGTPFVDEFDSLGGAALVARGWSVVALDTAFWARRGARPGFLTLYTLGGDNWPRAGAVPAIRNLVVREASSQCFAAELHFSGFFPQQNWQQAGLIVLEDTGFLGKSLRVSLGYNDFAGGFPATREVLIQAVTSLGRGSNNPEEIAHQRLFVVDSTSERLIAENLVQSALRIERRGRHYRLLYAVGLKNAPFKEVVETDLDLLPRYIGIFALKGFATDAADVPVFVDAFTLTPSECRE